MKEYQARHRDDVKKPVKNPECKEIPVKNVKNPNIEYMGNLRGDLEARQAAALRYPVGLNLAEKLTDDGWTSLIKYMLENLNPSYHESLRVGMSGPSLADLAPLMAKR